MRNVRHQPSLLTAPPTALSATRAALHRLAVYVISPAREAVTGRIGLRAVDGAFGTPLFGDAEIQLRVEGVDLVRSTSSGEARTLITTLEEAAAFVGVDIDATRSDRFDVPAAGALDEKLDVDAAASAWLQSWYSFGDSVLEALRAGFSAEEDVSVAQLWPEHFDLAISGGTEASGARANYGFSPGDGAIDEPYAYVGPWSADELTDSYWSGSTFSALRVSEILATTDHRASTLDFVRHGRELLRHGGATPTG